MFDMLFIVSVIGSITQLIKEKSEPVVQIKECKKYPEPHKNADGKIVIENCKLYNEDIMKYGAVQVGKWAKQGKYNLSKDELKKEHERIQSHIDKLCSL